MKKVRSSLRLSSASMVFLGAMAAPVAAQTAAPPEETSERAEAPADIVVTGSRIRRDPLSQDSPIVFVDQADIARTGLTNINDVLQRLPSSGGGLSSKYNNSGNLGNPPDGGGVGAGAAEIDLRFLGSRRVLVLVDGLRFVNGASASGVPGSTDLNAIPASAIERVEVLQDGASAIYGSDAIAGVVNIITKRRQRGFAASAQVGGYDEGDGLTQDYQLSWGNGDRGPVQVVIGGNYVKQDPVWSRDRALSAFPEPYFTSCVATCSSFTPNGRFLIFGGDRTLIAPVLGRASTPADFRNFSSPADRFNFQPFNYLQIPLERAGVFANLSAALSPSVKLTVKGSFNRRESRNQAAPLPFGVGVGSGLTPALSTIVISATNPFNPFGVDLNSTNTNAIFRRFIEGGPRRFQQTVDTTYAVATLDGSFSLGGRDWYWDLNGSYGRNKAEQTMLGNINASRLRQALGPIAACTSPCVPFNLFGGEGSITQSMRDFVMFEQNDSSKQTMATLSANISGSLFDLPGGPLGLAAGVEYRDLTGRFDPDPIVAAGFSSDIPAQPTRGSYDVREAYAELNAPLLANLPLVNLLELNGAVRLSDYSTSGSTTTFKAGVNWKPVRDLRLRGTYAEGFRAPSIGELFGTQSRFDQVLADPCSSQPGNTAPRRFANDATVRANCIAAGVPADGSYQQANAQIAVLTGGNQGLAPETSKSWIFGGVYSPSFFPRLSVEANHYNVELEGAIQAVNANITVTNCVVNNDPGACALLTRSSTGALIQVTGILQNIAAIKTRGIDLNVSYRGGQTPLGRLGLTWNNSWLRNYDVFVPVAGGIQKIQRAGTEQGAPSQAFPLYKTVGIIDLDGDMFGGSVTGRYVSGLKEQGTNLMKGVFYTDVQLRVNRLFMEGLGLAVGVNNLFNTKTPGCVTCESNNFAQTAHDVPGRFLYARLGFKL